MTKSLKRFFTSKTLSSTQQKVLLDHEESHHLTHVLRLKAGTPCIVFDAGGREWIGKVAENQPAQSAVIELVSPASPRMSVQSGVKLTVVQAIPQRGKIETIVEKAVELGVSKLIPVYSERSIVRYKDQMVDKVLLRWNKIVRAAQKQSGSVMDMMITKPCQLKEALDILKSCDMNFMCVPAATQTIREVVPSIRESLSKKSDLKVGLLIGPEGGLSEAEVLLAQKKGIHPITLGPHILRTDTAFVAAVSMFLLS